MDPYLSEWINLILRFVHVITGVAWIGASFYFVWLDNHLESPPQWKTDKGIKGDLWAIHGGGFYEVAKYQVAPKLLPQTLHWFKWEAYSTWISGFLLLCVIYYFGADAYLLDTRVAQLTQPQAICIGLLSIFGGWLVYEILCNSKLAEHGIVLGAILLGLTAGLAYGLYQLFSARGAYIHVGALIGTIMAGNVFRVIMPSQRALVKAVTIGSSPDPAWAIKAKLRSTHNTYTTLPVIFIMISSHYPMTYNHQYAWLILVYLFLITAAARWYFVLRHSGKQTPLLAAGVAVATLLLIYLMSPSDGDATKSVSAGRTPQSNPTIEPARVINIIYTHCIACHASNPTDEIFKVAPGGVIFDSYQDMIKWQPRIKARTIDTRDMPLLNKTGMTQSERDYLAAWLE